MKKIILSFGTYTDVNFLYKAQKIYDSLNGNTNFVNLVPSLPDVQAAISKYSDDLQAASTGLKAAIAQKNQSRAILEAILRQLGMSIMTEANGDEAKLATTGYTLSKNREPRYITNPGNVTITNGISFGQMIGSVKAVAGGISYVYEIAGELPAGATNWDIYTSSTCKFLFSNLIPGKQYWVRVAVIGSRGQKAYSTTATFFAQ